jgi:hypothetical protein
MPCAVNSDERLKVKGKRSKVKGKRLTGTKAQRIKNCKRYS